MMFTGFAKAAKPPKKPATVSDVEVLAGKLEPKLAKAIMDALLKQAAEVSIADIIRALESGDVSKVLALLDVAVMDDELGGIPSALNQATWAAGGMTAGHIQTVTGVTFRFNQLNPRLVTYLQTYSFNLIKQVGAQTREGVREYLTAGVMNGKPPAAMAREVRQIIGLTTRQAMAVKNFRKELETFHLRRTGGGYSLGSKIDRVNGHQVFRPDDDGLPQDGINERRLRDFRYDGQLKAAVASGVPLKPAQIDKMVEAYARKYLKHRSEVIARTEALRATNIGVQDAWRQAVESGKANETALRRRWLVAADERTCETCGPVPGMNPKLGVKFAQPFSTPKGPAMLPPLHPGCRCTVFVRSFTQKQIDDAENK